MDRREFSKRSLLLTAGILTGSHKIGMANEAGDTNNYYEEPTKKLPIRNFDVVVAGGGTAGVVGGIAPAPHRAKTPQIV